MGVSTDAVSNKRSAGRRARVTPAKPATAGADNTPQRVIDAAIECILAKGYYRASSNEIARWAGLTWGVIQYHFGTRERLMLDVLRDQGQKLIDHSDNYTFTGNTTRDQLWSVYHYLNDYFGRREYLASLEINLNLVRTPSTEQEIRAEVQRLHDAMAQVGQRNPGHVVSNPMVVEIVRSVIVSHRLRADASLTVIVDDEKAYRERIEMLVGALAEDLEKA